ncbi:BON domain-containing protein [Streptomyces aureus]
MSDGIVRLEGSVPDPRLQDMLVRVARTVPGVVDVIPLPDAAMSA